MANVMSGNVSTTKAIEVPSWVRGYHAYKELWSIEIDEVLELKHEHNNEQDKNNAIAIVRKGDVVGHIPRGLANTKDGAGIVRHFLTKHGSKADVKVIGKAVNRGGRLGTEVPSIYRFFGQKTTIDMLSKLLDIRNNLSVRVEKAECGQKRTTENSGRSKKPKREKT